MPASRGTDATRVLRGAQMVLDEIIKANEQNCKRNMKNCSIGIAFKDATIQFADSIGAAKLKVGDANAIISEDILNKSKSL